VGQSCAVQVAFVIDENLGLVYEAPKRCGVNDAIAVTLVFAAKGRPGLVEATAAAFCFVSCVRFH